MYIGEKNDIQADELARIVNAQKKSAQRRFHIWSRMSTPVVEQLIDEKEGEREVREKKGKFCRRKRGTSFWLVFVFVLVFPSPLQD